MITTGGGSSMNSSKDFSNIGLGIARSMAHTLGSAYAPHGVACAPGNPKAASVWQKKRNIIFEFAARLYK